MAGLAAHDDAGTADPLGVVAWGLGSATGFRSAGVFTGTPELGFGLSEASRDYSLGCRLSP